MADQLIGQGGGGGQRSRFCQRGDIFQYMTRLQNPNVIREEVERLLENITTLAEAASLATSTALTDELVSHGEKPLLPAW